ncbi:hypothetical protein pipiens_020524, partial [Culex pipiens pipiens]
MTPLTTIIVPNPRGAPSRNRDAPAPIAELATAKAKGPNEGKELLRSINMQQLAAEFAPFGTVSALRLVIDKETGRSKGFGYVQYVEAADASKAKGFQ